jgi:hypothetical protein
MGKIIKRCILLMKFLAVPETKNLIVSTTLTNIKITVVINPSECRKLNEGFHDLYSSPTIVRVIKSRRMRWAGHIARMKKGRGVYKVLVMKPEGKRTLARTRRRWENNIQMDLQELRCGVWAGLSRLRIETDGGHL